MNWKPFDSLTTHSAFHRCCHPDRNSWCHRSEVARICSSQIRGIDSGRWIHIATRVSKAAQFRNLEPQSTRFGSPADNKRWFIFFSFFLSSFKSQIRAHVHLTCAPIALSALVKLILANCPCVMYCQCSFSAFSPHISNGGKSESGNSQRRRAAAAQPRPNHKFIDF